jgi:DNA repair exonuclease SbcCD ATPase subunit
MSGTDRVVNFSKEFKEKAPFEYNLVTELNAVEEGEDVPFEVSLSGKVIPEKVYVKSKQGTFLLKKVAKNKFAGKLVQVREDMDFQFVASFEKEKYPSDDYHIDVIAKTAIGKLQATLNYPKYLGRTNEVVENAGDLIIPEGTVVNWSVLTKNSNEVQFLINEKSQLFKKQGFSVNQKFVNDATAQIILKNKTSGKLDSTALVIDVVKDEFPRIQVEEVQDSVKDGIRYFSGVVGDDYGLNGLRFVYEIISENGEMRQESMNVGSVPGTESPFNFAVDFRKESVKLNDKIEYRFVVYDNDGVNGSKSTSSRMFVYKLPDLEELNEKREEEQEKAKEDLSSVMDKAAKFKENLDKLRKETMNSKQSNWNQENQVDQLQEDHKSLMEDLQSLQEEMKNSAEEKNQLSEMDKELLEKQQMIEDLLEELMDEELKDLLDQLEELMKEQNKEQLDENMEQLEMNSEDMKKQLDRTMEMLKKMQVDEKIDAIEEQLKELSEEQEKLAEEVKDSDKVTEEQKEDQKEIDDKFEKIKEDIQEMDSLNNELSRPMEMGDQEQNAEGVEQELNDAEKSLEKGKSGKAGESQQNASDKMEEMAEEMDMMQEQSNQQQQQEDMTMLRNILESLVNLSFDQEETMFNLERVADTDPAFKTHSRRQRRIIDDTKIVSDSLYELAKRQPKIAKFIDDELNQISANHGLSLEDIDERRRSELTIHQQYVMTSYNNLALMLNESLQQMQNAMRNQMPGSGSCNKPGGKGMPKPGDGMSSESMKKMLQKQLDSMKKGQQEGGKQPGDKKGKQPGGKQGGGMGQMGMGSKEMAKMAAEQGAIRRRLEQLRKELNKDGSGNGNKLNDLIKELEEQERDIINKRLDNNSVERQKEILTRLLESEKALMERGFDEKRESKSPKNENYSNQIRFDEYNKEKLRQIELLRAVDPAYSKYYKDRANEYFNSVF